jgi:hypothetical protein
MRQFQNIEVGTEVGIIEYMRYGRGIGSVARGKVVDVTTKTFKVVWDYKAGPSNPIVYNKNTGIEWGRGDRWTHRGTVTADMVEVARCEEKLAEQTAEREAEQAKARRERDRKTGLVELDPQTITYKTLEPIAEKVAHWTDRAVAQMSRAPRALSTCPTPAIRDFVERTYPVARLDSDHDAREIGYATTLVEIWTQLINSATHWHQISPAMRRDMYKTYTYRDIEVELCQSPDSWVTLMLPRFIQDYLSRVGDVRSSRVDTCAVAATAGSDAAHMDVLKVFQKLWMQEPYYMSMR